MRTIIVLSCFCHLLGFVYAQDELYAPVFADTADVVSKPIEPPFLEINGFMEGRVGGRTNGDKLDDMTTLAEARLQLEAEKVVGPFTLNITSDLVLDPEGKQKNSERQEIDHGLGQRAIDLRQASVLFSPASNIDIKVGRQTMTWGLGDLIFINDLFAKDFRSFFLGRDDEYLKAPSNAIKGSIFSNFANLDVVYTPRFASDRFINGRRVSFFDGSINGIRNRENPMSVDIPSRWFKDDELSIRAFRSLGAYEGALYFYNGFWKSPAGQDSILGASIFPRLKTFGVSFRGPLSVGIMSLEGGYYHSPPMNGRAANTGNGLRVLVGYEIELGQDFTLGLQYYFEHHLEEKKYNRGWSHGTSRARKFRDIGTFRITKLLLNQYLRISLYNFFSPTDQDGYLRWQTSYRVSDGVKINGGLNLFYGQDPFTFFNQFESSSNVYFGLRFLF